MRHAQRLSIVCKLGFICQTGSTRFINSMGLSAVSWLLELTNCYYQQWWIVSFLKNFLTSILLNLRSSPHAVPVTLCASRYRYAACTECKQGLRENMDWNSVMWAFSKWSSGMDWITTHWSCPLYLTLKGNWQIYDHIWVHNDGYMIIYLNSYSGHYIYIIYWILSLRWLGLKRVCSEISVVWGNIPHPP